MHIFTTSATVASLLAHLMFGCCWHHVHAARAVNDHQDCAAAHSEDAHVAACSAGHGNSRHGCDRSSHEEPACPEGRCELDATVVASSSKADLSLAYDALPLLACETARHAGCHCAAQVAHAIGPPGAPPPRYLVLEILRL